VVAVVVDAPLDVDGLAGRVLGDRSVAPEAGARLVVVDADAGVVSARSAAAGRGSLEVGPRRDGLEDGALRAGVDTRLFVADDSG